MHVGRIIRGTSLALGAAGALALGAGTASASTPTQAPELTAFTAVQPTWHPRDFCDDWNHRGDRRCHGDRWNWDNRYHRWDHDRWDGHRWNRR